MIELIKHAIKIHEDNLSKLDMYRLECSMGTENFQQEFKTIHLNIGRITGKSFAASMLARPQDLIITHNTARADSFIKQYPNTLAGVIPIRKLFPDRGRNTEHYIYDWVWIDEPSLCDDFYDINQVYTTIQANLFIKLGE